jgi:hypothetical protein
MEMEMEMEMDGRSLASHHAFGRMCLRSRRAA